MCEICLEGAQVVSGAPQKHSVEDVRDFVGRGEDDGESEVWLKETNGANEVIDDDGVSPSGKAADFGSAIPGFESLHPSQI